jgi:hypothetical protein
VAWLDKRTAVLERGAAGGDDLQAARCLVEMS